MSVTLDEVKAELDEVKGMVKAISSSLARHDQDSQAILEAVKSVLKNQVIPNLTDLKQAKIRKP